MRVDSPEWYETVYHGNLKLSDEFGAGDHPEKNRRCLEDLGVSPNDAILSAGCGAGDNIYLLDDVFDCRNITAVDWSRPALQYVNAHFPWVKTVRANVAAMPFVDGSFDKVTALDVTEHLNGITYVFFLMEALRVLRPGGRIAVLPGMTRRPEHINLLPIVAVHAHLMRVGFEIVCEKEEWIIGERPE